MDQKQVEEPTVEKKTESKATIARKKNLEKGRAKRLEQLAKEKEIKAKLKGKGKKKVKEEDLNDDDDDEEFEEFVVKSQKRQKPKSGVDLMDDSRIDKLISGIEKLSTMQLEDLNYRKERAAKKVEPKKEVKEIVKEIAKEDKVITQKDINNYMRSGLLKF